MIDTNFKNAFYKNNENIDNKRNFLNFGLLGIQKFLDIDRYLYKFFIVLGMSVFMGCLNFLLIERSGIYTPGVNALHQSFARLVKAFWTGGDSQYVYISLFWGLNIVFNLVFAVFCYKKIGKRFTTLTVVYVVGLSLTGVGLSLLFNHMKWDKFYLFSDPNSANNTLVTEQIKLLPWPTDSYKSDGYKTIIILIYGFVYAVFNSAVSLIIYAVDGSMGGLDWIVFYLYKTKKHSSNKLFFIFGLIISFSAYLIGTYFPFVIKASGMSVIEKLPNLFSPTFLATLLMIFTKKMLFNNYYPQFKLVKVTVFTNKMFEVRDQLLTHKFPHSFTITNSIGSYKLKNQTQLEFICFVVELSQLIQHIRVVDKQCLIVATKINIVNGYLYVEEDLD